MEVSCFLIRITPPTRSNWIGCRSSPYKQTGEFQIVLKDGDHLAGKIKKVPETEAQGKDFEVHTVEEKKAQRRPERTWEFYINTNKRNFWRQLTGALDLGYSFTSGNTQTSLSTDANAYYQATKWKSGSALTTSFSGQSAGSKTNLLGLDSMAERYTSGNSSVTALTDFLHSSQQDLQLRVTIGGGYGRYLKRTNTTTLGWIAGAVFVHEEFLIRAWPADK